MYSPFSFFDFHTNIVKGERRIKYRNLFRIFFLPNRILYSLNIAKGESRKYSERREQRQIENVVFNFDYAEPHPIFYKYSERREQRQIENVVFNFDYAEPHPIFYKYSENLKQVWLFYACLSLYLFHEYKRRLDEIGEKESVFSVYPTLSFSYRITAVKTRPI